MMKPSIRQQQVIDEPGNCLAVAGPGSGKTATMVAKIASIVESPNTSVVAVTFTRDAAEEMNQRLIRAIDSKRMARVKVGTFHSLTLRHLESQRQKPRIITPQQQRQYLDRASSTYEGDKSQIQQLFEMAKCALEPIKEIEAETWFRQYQSMLTRTGMVDLYDVMRDATVRMRDGSLALLPCTHLIADEFQDCDEVQYEWVGAHTRKGVITTVVGDDDQTIYEWRRAIGYDGMVRFARDFDAAVVALGDNYRSLGTIVQAADRLIAFNNPNRLRKDLISKRGPGGHIFTIMRGTPADGIDAAADMILSNAAVNEAYENTSTPYTVPTGSWAVLARNNRLLQTAEASLNALGVRTYRGSGSIYDSDFAQVYLGLIETIQSASQVGLDAAMHHFGINEADIDSVLKSAKGNMASLLDGQFGNFGQLNDSSKVDAFFTKTRVWRRLSREGEYRSLFDRVSRFVVESTTEKRSAFARMICDSIESRLNKMQGSPLQRIRRIQQDRAKKEPKDSVCLYTMHGAKGLEFENTVIVGLDDDIIPGDVENHAAPAEVANIPSERRLFYVALTRAKNRLWLVYTGGRPSRFLAELPNDLVEVAQPASHTPALV